MFWRTPTSSLWNPWAELDRVQRELENAFGRVAGNARSAWGEFPAVNIWSGTDTALLTAELPGIDPAKIEVTVENDTVTIRGERVADPASKDQTYLRQERGTGAFVRSFAMPFRVDAAKVSAHYQKGILQVTVPRAEEDKPKQIKVKAA
jgi:HSP20 family protein